MYADRANMILMTGFLISGMVTIPIALIVLWHMHSKKKRELKLLKENLRLRNMYGNYMVPPGSAHDKTRMFATMEGPYDPQRWPSAPADPDHWTAMRMMLGSRDQPRQLGATTGPGAGPQGDAFVLGASGQFVGPLYRPTMMQPNAQPYGYAQQNAANYNTMMPMTMPSCQMQGGPGQSAPNPNDPMYANASNPPQWRNVMCQAQPQMQPAPPPSIAGSTGSLDWVQNLGAVPRQIDVNLDHANTVGGCGMSETDPERAASEANSQQPQPPPLQTKMIPASQLAS